MQGMRIGSSAAFSYPASGIMGGGVKETVPKSEKKKDGNEWTDKAVDLLLELYEQKWRGVSFGNLRVKDWEHVASTMDEKYCWQGERKTFLQCKNKIENLKKRYKMERDKKNEDGEVSSDWPWFTRLNDIIGKAPKQAGVLVDDSEGGTLALGLGSTVESPEAGKECKGEGQGRGVGGNVLGIVPIAIREDTKVRTLGESQISSERTSFVKTPPGNDRKQGCSTGAFANGCTQNVPDGSGKSIRKRRRNNSVRCPVKELSACFSNFVNYMAKAEVERMQMMRELLTLKKARKRPCLSSGPAFSESDQCRLCCNPASSSLSVRDVIHQKLYKVLTPTKLEVQDVSVEEVAGVPLEAGKTHFNVRIVSNAFDGQTPVQRHRAVYLILQDELKGGVHALSIVARTPLEAAVTA